MRKLARFIASISVIPVGTKTTSLSEYVAEAIKALRNANVDYELTPMSTILHSDNIDDILRAIKVVHNALRSMGLDRVVIHINIDARHDKPQRRPSDKVKAVLEKLER